jgi:hypothetical protein
MPDSDHNDGLYRGLKETDNFLKLINGLPSEMQLVMIRGYVANMLKRYEQPAEIQERAA